MTGNEYKNLAMRTNDKMGTVRVAEKIDESFSSERITENVDFGGILNACLGLSGEVGETNDMIKKWIFHDSELDIEHLKKEIGDVMWYVALLCDSFGFDLDEILEIERTATCNVVAISSCRRDRCSSYLCGYSLHWVVVLPQNRQRQ